MQERREVSVQDVVKSRPIIANWLDKMLNDLGSRVAPKIKEMDPARRQEVIDSLTETLSLELIRFLARASLSKV